MFNNLLPAIVLAVSSPAAGQVIEVDAERTVADLRQGQPAPELILESLLQAPEGAKTDWESLRGKVVVIEFWATWCGPCVSTGLPHTNELARHFKSRPVTFISITTEDQERISRFIKRVPMEGWVGLDTDQSVMRAYSVYRIPKTVVIDAQGRLAAMSSPTQITVDVIDQVLAGQMPQLELQIDQPVAVKSSPETGEGDTAVVYEIVVRRFAQRPSSRMGHSSGFKRMWSGISLRDALSRAAHLPQDRVIGPAMLDETFVHVLVQVPETSGQDVDALALNAMETAFGITTRTEPRMIAVLVLKQHAPGAHLLKKAEELDVVQFVEGSMNATGVSIERLRSTLESILKMPIVDQTGLTEVYDFALQWEADKPDSLHQALPAQLGLTLAREERSMETLVVEVSATDHP